MQPLMIFLPALVGGTVQSLTGFGSSIFTMLIFPLMFPMLKATALSSFTLLWLNLFLMIQYRKWIQPKLIAIPMASYLSCNFLGVQLARMSDVGKLKSVFGVFLIIMALYFIFFDKKIKVSGRPVSALVCGGLAGFLAGMFGIGGPPMAIYMLAVTNDKNTYIANIQSVFVTGCISATLVRFSAGIFTVDMIPLAIPGVIGVWVGKQIGVRILDRINIETVRKCVYDFLIFSGAVTFITSI